MIGPFRGEWRFLSNFYPVNVTVGGVVYPTVEHAYQAAKTPIAAERLAILLCTTPGQAKRMGKKIAVRLDWSVVRIAVMRDLQRQKFSRPDLRTALLATGNDPIAEINDWGDTFWGISNGAGENWLGKILMDIREEYRNIMS